MGGAQYIKRTSCKSESLKLEDICQNVLQLWRYDQASYSSVISWIRTQQQNIESDLSVYSNFDTSQNPLVQSINLPDIEKESTYE